MSKPKKIKDVMPAPERRNLIHLDMIVKGPKSATHVDRKKRANRNQSRREYDSRSDGW